MQESNLKSVSINEKKSVLIISKLFPFPPYQNGETSTLYNLIKCDEIKKYKVDLLYLEENQNKNEFIFKSEIETVYRKTAIGNDYWASISGKKRIKPTGLWNITTKGMGEFDASKYDIVIFGSWIETCLLDKIVNLNAYKIIFAADSPVLYYCTKNRNEKRTLHRLYNEVQKRLWLSFEKTISSCVDKIVFVSEKDAHVTSEHLDENIIHVARIGVKQFKNEYMVNEKQRIEIGFSGIMTYEPNRHAVEYIINKLIPELDNRKLDYRIHIIGKDPDPMWISYANENGNIVITGFVDDIDSYISKMDIYISPLFTGSGMKNKILQALSIGVPIIATQVSADGIDGMKDNCNFSLCDENPTNWAALIESLYNNPEKRKRYSENGKRLVKEDYSWDRFARDLLQ